MISDQYRLVTMDIFNSNYPYYKKLSLEPQKWNKFDLNMELTPLQKACINVQYSKVSLLLKKRDTLVKKGEPCPDTDRLGAGLSPLQCCLNEHACLLMRHFNHDTKRTYKYRVARRLTRSSFRARMKIINALLDAGFHESVGWGEDGKITVLPWGTASSEEIIVIMNKVTITAQQVISNVAHFWYDSSRWMYHSPQLLSFLENIHPFTIRFARFAKKYQSKILAVNVKHGLIPDHITDISSFNMFYYDSAYVFHLLMCSVSRVKGGPSRIGPTELTWLTKIMNSILDTDVYKPGSLHTAMLMLLDVIKSESMIEYDNQILDTQSHRLPALECGKFELLTRAVITMYCLNNHKLGSFSHSVLRYLTGSVMRLYQTDINNKEAFDRLSCCIITFLSYCKFNLESPHNKVKETLHLLFKVSESKISDRLPIVLVREYVSSDKKIQQQMVSFPKVLEFLGTMDIDVNQRSIKNRDNMLMACIGGFKFCETVLETLLKLKVYPFAVDSNGNCFARMVDEFFDKYRTLDEEDRETLEELIKEYPILAKPYPLKILSVRIIVQYPSFMIILKPQQYLYKYALLHC